jgi:polar amino acid transport system permease protein
MYIILPQTIRRLVPVSINLATRMIKTTSLIALIGVVEVLKTGQQIIEGNRYTAPKAAFVIYAVIFFLYFFSCWPLSVLGKRLEKKWSL